MSNYSINFVTASELLNETRPEPLIEGFIQEQEAVCLYGVPNGGKSFLALDWALCVATGKPWLDTYAVKQGPVIYMAGEGAPSLQRRVQAWCDYHKIHEINGAYFQLRPLPLRDEDVITEIQATLETFAEPIRGEGDEAAMSTRLIVVDTLSQFFGGGDENGPDMALFVNNLRRLSHDADTAVLIVHHSNKGGIQERGHTALRGNLDVMFQCMPVMDVERLDGLTIVNDKQRDNPRAKRLALKLKLVGDSLVVVPTMDDKVKLPKVSATLMHVLEGILNTEDPLKEVCRNVELADYLGKSVPAVHENLQNLEGKKLVKHGERGFSSLTTLGRLVLDDAGIEREDIEEEDE